jgi:hypothetical protein
MPKKEMACLASRKQPRQWLAWQAGRNVLPKQFLVFLVSRTQPAHPVGNNGLLGKEEACQEGVGLLGKQGATCTRLLCAWQAGHCLLGEQVAYCSPSRQHPSWQAGRNLLTK